MHVAKLYEAKLIAVKKGFRNPTYPVKNTMGNNNSATGSVDGYKRAVSPWADSKIPTSSRTQTPTISPSELARRRDLGLCYLCNEKWSRGHKCKEKKLYMLVADEGDEGEDTEEAPLTSENVELSPGNTQGLFEISLQALSGSMHYSTMKLRGSIKNKPVMILVDSGSTHSFIDSHFSERIGLQLSDSKPFEVMVTNGERLTSKGLCADVSIDCQGTKIITNLLQLPIIGCHIVLGANWLSTLGDITWNFQTLTMKYIHDG